MEVADGGCGMSCHLVVIGRMEDLSNWSVHSPNQTESLNCGPFPAIFEQHGFICSACESLDIYLILCS